jgi:hypothetical protein
MYGRLVPVPLNRIDADLREIAVECHRSGKKHGRMASYSLGSFPLNRRHPSERASKGAGYKTTLMVNHEIYGMPVFLNGVPSATSS